MPTDAIADQTPTTTAATTMQAITHAAFGGPEVLELSELPVPTPGATEVLVRVHASALDRGVWHLVHGTPYLIRLARFGVRRPKHPIPGMDLAGVVEAVGSEVTAFAPGDRVFGTSGGSFADYVVCDPTRLAALPVGLTFQQGAAVPISATTALHALRDQGHVQAGQRVLIIGASGGVGSFAVQLAKAFGAEVTGVCTTAKVERVRSIGADHVIDHTRDDIDRDLDSSHPGYDLILDIGGNRPLSTLRKALTERGTLVIVGGEDNGPWSGGLHRQLGAVLQSPFRRQSLKMFVAPERGEDLRTLTPLLESGEVTPLIDRVYPLADAADALRRLESGEVCGKVVIAVNDGTGM